MFAGSQARFETCSSRRSSSYCCTYFLQQMRFVGKVSFTCRPVRSSLSKRIDNGRECTPYEQKLHEAGHPFYTIGSPQKQLVFQSEILISTIPVVPMLTADGIG